MMRSFAGVIFLYAAIYIVQGIIWGWATNKIVENKGYNENWFWWGFFFGLIALIVALTKPDINGQQQTAYTPMYGNVSNNSSTLFREKRVASGTEWTCAYCHRINQAFVGTCACGHSKSESDEKHRRDQAETRAFIEARPSSQPNSFEGFAAPLKEEHPVFSAATNQPVQSKPVVDEQTEETKVKAIRQYKALMDEGIISPEEFEAKKKELLGL